MKALADARREIIELKKTIADLQPSSLSTPLGAIDTQTESYHTELASLGQAPPGAGSICEICAQFIREIMPAAPSVTESAYAPPLPGKRNIQLQSKGDEQQLEQQQSECVVECDRLDNDETNEENGNEGKEQREVDSSESECGDEVEAAAGQETVQRCAICRMDAGNLQLYQIYQDSSHQRNFCKLLNNSDEADQLQMDTGEYLGELFSCDGNCGEMFHVRCAGALNAPLDTDD